jgi:hypothetical protein
MPLLPLVSCVLLPWDKYTFQGANLLNPCGEGLQGRRVDNNGENLTKPLLGVEILTMI